MKTYNDLDNLEKIKTQGQEIQEEFHKNNIKELEREKDRVEVQKEDIIKLCSTAYSQS